MGAVKDTGSTSPRRAARAEAAAWMVRLHSPDRSAEIEAGFRAWLAADAENGRQFERVTEVWDAGAVPVSGVPRMTQWSTHFPASGGLLMSAAIVTAVLLAGWSANRYWLNPAYSTGVGEQRIVRLEDGSRISLNSSTHVAVAYRGGSRRIRIEHGEAYFEVARDPSRPFIVTAGDRHITALGTSFVVQYDATRIAVTLVDGKIAVSSPLTVPAPHEPQAFTLTPGERVIFNGEKAKVDVPRIDAITAWRRGEVILDKTVLADAIAEMNRYDDSTLVIDDPRIAGLQVSGIYHTGDSDGFAQTMARLYGLEVSRQQERIHLRLAGSPPPP